MEVPTPFDRNRFDRHRALAGSPSRAAGRANWIRPTAWVNLRESPSPTAAVVTIVPKGVKLRIIGRKRSWVQVNNPATSQSGWIYGNNVAAAR